MKFTIIPDKPISFIPLIETCKHKIVKGTKEIWYVPIRENSGDGIFTPGLEEKPIVPIIAEEKCPIWIKDPILRTPQELLEDTNYNITDKQLNQVVIGKSLSRNKRKFVTIENIIVEEITQQVSNFFRGLEMAEEISKKEKIPVYVYIQGLFVNTLLEVEQ